MDEWPHGIALIINNINFTDDAASTRDGAGKDEQNLVTIFRYLGYFVHLFNDLSAKEIKIIMEEMQKKNHGDYDSFVCCILSHGGKNVEKEEYICGSDKLPVELETIYAMLHPQKCPSLASKPKIFFIQACRGVLKEELCQPDCSNPAPENPAPVNSQQDSPPSTSINVGEKADFCHAYATPSGYVAWRDKNHGSYYIIELCRAMALYSTYSSLLDIIIEANQKLSEKFRHQKENGPTVTQTIQTTSTLTSKVFFFKD